MLSLDARPLLFVISGPSGAGKSTAVTAIADRQLAKRITTYTTRPRRVTETNGIEYRFVDQKTFFQLHQQGEIYEYSQRYAEYYYGSPRAIATAAPEEPLVINLDTIGYVRVKVTSARRVVGIFITTPSPDVIYRRLASRVEAGIPEDAELRGIDYIREFPLALTYDYMLLNDDLGSFISDLESTVQTELSKSRSALWMTQKGLNFLREEEPPSEGTVPRA